MIIIDLLHLKSDSPSTFRYLILTIALFFFFAFVLPPHLGYGRLWAGNVDCDMSLKCLAQRLVVNTQLIF